ncbi:MAG: hypothetical protein OEZ43_01480 [Gammaproteobacteria bacterium]|nr:hypothetical protein [Gammaproteobacteria bacterium]
MREKEQIDDDLELDSDGETSDSEVEEDSTPQIVRSGSMNPAARRRLEEYRERKALEDLLRDDFDSYLAGI